MKKHAISVLILLFAFGISAASAQTTPSFTISATNTTMTASGASIPFTLSSFNGYTGLLVVACEATNPPAGARLPYCGDAGPIHAITLNASGTAKGSVSLFVGPVPVTAARLALPGHSAGTAWAFAAALLLDFGLRRRKARWLSVLLLSVGLLAGFSSLTACAGGPPTLTPGTYSYTLTATDTNTNASASTIVSVIVPAGIPAKPM